MIICGLIVASVIVAAKFPPDRVQGGFGDADFMLQDFAGVIVPIARLPVLADEGMEVVGSQPVKAPQGIANRARFSHDWILTAMLGGGLCRPSLWVCRVS